MKLAAGSEEGLLRMFRASEKARSRFGRRIWRSAVVVTCPDGSDARRLMIRRSGLALLGAVAGVASGMTAASRLTAWDNGDRFTESVINQETRLKSSKPR